jgi:NitT/TauT family transport system substrate-binding protein
MMTGIRTSVRLWLAAAMGIAAVATGGAAQAQTKITVAYTAVSDFAPGFIAVEQGLFKKRGLDVDFKLVPLNPQIPAALQSDSMQIGGTTTPVQIQAVDGGLDLVAVAGSGVTRRNDTLFGVLARVEAPITTPQGFIGKKVGTPGLGAFLHVMFRQWLIDKGVDPKQVTFIEVGFPQHLDVLKAGSIDAVITGQPFTTRIVQAGVGVLATNFSDNLTTDLPIITYASTRAWAEKNPKAATGFREAIAEASAMANDPKNVEIVRAAVGKYISLPPPVLQSLVFGKWQAELTEDGLRAWVKMMKGQGMIQTDIDVTKLIVK